MDRKCMGTSTRYIEVAKSTYQAMQKALSYGRASAIWDGIIKMRGLPYKVTEGEIRSFFDGLTIINGGVFIPTGERGDGNGTAFVQFDSYSIGQQAMKNDKKHLGGRYVDLFKASNTDLRKAIVESRKMELSLGYQNREWGNQMQMGNNGNNQSQPVVYGGLNMSGGGKMAGMNRLAAVRGQAAPYARPENNYGMGIPPPAVQAPQAQVTSVPDENNPFPHIVEMRNAPDTVNNSDIQSWMMPNKAIAVKRNGPGIFDVAFKTHKEACMCMVKEGEIFQGRSINLILKSKPVENTNAGFEVF